VRASKIGSEVYEERVDSCSLSCQDVDTVEGKRVGCSIGVIIYEISHDDIAKAARNDCIIVSSVYSINGTDVVESDQA